MNGPATRAGSKLNFSQANGISVPLRGAKMIPDKTPQATAAGKRLGSGKKPVALARLRQARTITPRTSPIVMPMKVIMVF